MVGVQNWGQLTVPGVRDGHRVTPGEHRVGRERPLTRSRVGE